MKRQFSRSGNRAILSGGRLAALALVGVVLILLIVRALLPDLFTTIARPLWGAGDLLTAAIGSVSLEPVDDVRAERDHLLRELEAVRNERDVLAARASDLARLAGTEPVPASRILAGVLVRPPISPYDSLVVAAGSRDGVKAGAGVYGPGGMPLGTVELVSEGSAHVSLYSAPGRVTEGWVGEGRIPLSITGAGGGSYRAEVAKDAGITENAQVFVPGPGALPIGVVARVDTDPSSTEATLFIRPLANPFTLTWVAIGDVLP